MPRALLVHGLQSSAAGWWQVERWLADAGWQVTTRNLLGHGGRGAASDYSFAAYAADLDEDHQDWDLVVGHSLGGAVSITIAAGRPEFAARIILIDPALLIPGDQRDEVTAGLIADMVVTREVLIATQPDWVPNDIDAKLFSLDGLHPDATVGTIDANDPWDVRGPLADVRAPTLLLTGDPEVFTMVPPWLAEEVGANPAIEYRVVPGGGHSPHRNRADATRELMLDWLG
jgi:pimeloyl-ACP methyl ester carboxylesterase